MGQADILMGERLGLDDLTPGARSGKAIRGRSRIALGAEAVGGGIMNRDRRLWQHIGSHLTPRADTVPLLGGIALPSTRWP
jgi:hypothetical protein